MGNAAHLLNEAAGMEMIASQDHPLVLSSGSHRGTTARRAARLRPLHLAARGGSSAGHTGRRLAVLSEQRSLQMLIETSAVPLFPSKY